jgi:uncharacterized repeat protein (TIGR03803 family)
VFTLQPQPTSCPAVSCDWIENSIYKFVSLDDGMEPMGNLAFDQAGNIYGATTYGGTNPCGTNPPGCGSVFQLTRSGSSWVKTTIYNFAGTDGEFPIGGVIIDRFGNLYGILNQGGANNFGAVFELTPSGSGWTEILLHTFQFLADGGAPWGGLIMDAAGNLYGTTPGGGSEGGGTVFELSPSGGSWTFSVIASLPGLEGAGPRGNLAFDSAGNLYGTTPQNGAYNSGSIFKLTHSGAQWTYTDLYDFTDGADGSWPQAGPTVDASGTIYGVAAGGPAQNGFVWEMTP